MSEQSLDYASLQYEPAEDQAAKWAMVAFALVWIAFFLIFSIGASKELPIFNPSVGAAIGALFVALIASRFMYAGAINGRYRIEAGLYTEWSSGEPGRIFRVYKALGPPPFTNWSWSPVFSSRSWDACAAWIVKAERL